MNHVLTKIYQITTPFLQSCNATNRRVRDKFCNRSIIILFTCKFFKSQSSVIELLNFEFELKMSNKKCIIPSYYLNLFQSPNNQNFAELLSLGQIHLHRI